MPQKKTQKKPKPVKKKTTAPKSLPVKKKTPAGKRQEALRAILVAKRKEVVRDMEAHLGKHLHEALPSRENVVFDSGDRATQDISEEMDLSFQERRASKLRLIDEAIQRLQDKTYGICEECGMDIPEPRLSAMPFAKYCIPCQEQQEAIEDLAREEDRLK
ncbi:MAG TPA: TraR/DksA C4-type zinc finger protein [Nitrospiria bacterium]|nr:TraR/DksA C4-type zinc finger protein [Nitrospiria bacterium]